jgi:hypothetical protein
MPNYYVNKSLKVIDATPYKIENYGYLYLLHCINTKTQKTFYQVTQEFEPYKLNLSPNNIYRHIKEKNVKVISLNRGEEKDLNWAVEKAKNLVEKKKDDFDYWNYKEEKPADPDYVSKLLQNKINEWKKEDENHWYAKAKNFVKKIFKIGE